MSKFYFFDGYWDCYNRLVKFISSKYLRSATRERKLICERKNRNIKSSNIPKIWFAFQNE